MGRRVALPPGGADAALWELPAEAAAGVKHARPRAEADGSQDLRWDAGAGGSLWDVLLRPVV